MITSTNETIQIEESVVSWAAIVAGAAETAALSLILITLGTGLAVASPGSHSGASATTISVSDIIWIIASSLIAATAGEQLKYHDFLTNG